MFRFMKLFQINKGMALWSFTPLLLKKNFLKKIEISRGGRVGGEGADNNWSSFSSVCTLWELYAASLQDFGVSLLHSLCYGKNQIIVL